MGQSNLELMGQLGKDTIQEDKVLLDLEEVLALGQEVRLEQDLVQEQGLHLGQEPVQEQGLHLESFHHFHFQWWLWEPLLRSHLILGSLLSWWHLGWSQGCQRHWYWYYR